MDPWNRWKAAVKQFRIIAFLGRAAFDQPTIRTPSSVTDNDVATTKAGVMAMLKDAADQRGIDHWNKRGYQLKSFGIGLTRLRKMAKSIGRDHRLAGVLWRSSVYDAKVLGLLIDDPKLMTRDQVESQIDDGLADGMLTHVFASCDATLSKTTFAFEAACDWMESKDPVRRRSGYGLLYELSKKNPKGMDDEFLAERISIIQENIHREDMWVRESMNTALMGIGKRNKKLNQLAIKAAKAIGPVDIDYGSDNSCEPLDVLKHLTSSYLKQKFAG